MDGENELTRYLTVLILTRPDLEVEDLAQTRLTSKYDNLDQLSSAFKVKHTTQSYQAQFASLYYLRLAKLKKLTQDRSIKKWNEIPGELLVQLDDDSILTDNAYYRTISKAKVLQ